MKWIAVAVSLLAVSMLASALIVTYKPFHHADPQTIYTQNAPCSWPDC